MKREEYDAVILAGAKNNGALKEASSASYEALIRVLGRPMIDYVIEALAACSRIKRILVVGPGEELVPEVRKKVNRVLEGGSSIVENIKRGIEALKTEDKVLIITSDIPLITPTAISEFLTMARDREADIVYPIIAREENERQFPGKKRTYIRVREGSFTGGNIFLFDPLIIRDHYQTTDKVISCRKKPLQMSSILGFFFLIRFFFGLLTLSDIEKKLYKALGIKGKAIIVPNSVIGFDVDKPEDLEVVEGILNKNNN